MKAALLALLALSGCYFKTRDTLVETPLAMANTSTTVVTASRPDIAVKAWANAIAFRAETRRQCMTQTTQQFEIVHGKKVAIAMLHPILMLGWLAAPAVMGVVVAASASIAVVQARGYKTETSTETRVVSHRLYACSERLAGQLVHVELPSGASMDVLTNERGIASVTIPDTEVDHGTAHIVFDNVTRPIDYDRRAYDQQQLAIEVDDSP